MEGTLAVVTCFAGNFAPRNWQFCNGQTLQITSNQALFALIGTLYGGNGTSTFNLPNLQSRIPVGTGTGVNGAPTVNVAQIGGAEKVTLISANLPPHVHNGPVNVQQQCNSVTDGSGSPTGAYLSNGTPNGYSTVAGNSQFYKAGTYTATIQTAGSSQPVSIIEPYIAVYYIICTAGLFPSRN